MSTPILLLTHSADYYTIDNVEAALRERGVDCARINTDAFPTQLRLVARYENGAAEFWLEGGDRSLPLHEVPAIWNRRLWPGDLPPSFDGEFQGYCKHVSRFFFFELFSMLEGVFMVNPIAAATAAESKVMQMRAAARVGLRIPPTLVTNSAEAVRAAWNRWSSGMVTKMLVPLSQSMNADGNFIHTNRLSEEDVAALDGLEYSPQIFQPLLDKQLELRVIVVGRRVFAASIDTRHSVAGRIDWRLAAPGELSWEPYEVDADTQNRVFRLMDNLGLFYGALDFVVDGAGPPIFLEINQAGEYGWLERDLHLPISAAIAELLIARP